MFGPAEGRPIPLSRLAPTDQPCRNCKKAADFRPSRGSSGECRLGRKVMAGPLSGVRIVDVTSMLSGPWATMILADQGADVIKVEATGGDHIRSLGTRRGGMSSNFLNINRNQRSIALDLKAA